MCISAPITRLNTTAKNAWVLVSVFIRKKNGGAGIVMARGFVCTEDRKTDAGIVELDTVHTV